MKRTLSLVLALVMVLGTFSVTFAAEKTVEEKAGEILKTLEVMTGDDAGLRLEDGLKREEAVVMIARLKGQLEVAQNFPTKPTYKDITNKAYEPLLAWAKEDGTFVGHSETKFGFGDNITTQEYASVVLRILGYEVGVEKEITWNDVMAKAEELGLLKNIDAKADFLRGNMAVMTLNALRTNVKDSKETLAEKLELDVPAEEPELSTDIEITAAKAVANNKVEVKVKEEVAASVADFTIVKKGTTTEVEIKDVVKESAKVFVLETEALVGGTAYTVKSNGKELNFTGIKVDTTAPTVVKVSAVDTNTFEITFSDVMDKVTAENVENYGFNKNLNVVSAKLSSSRKVVTLTVDAAKRNTAYTLTIENVTNSDGKVMNKVTRNVTAIEYKTAPTIISAKPLTSRMVEVKFKSGNYGMNKESLEASENYSIKDLAITEVKAYDADEDDLYETVVLYTEEQTAGKSYTLTVEGVKDDSVLQNVLVKTTRTLRGLKADTVSPQPQKATPTNNNEIEVLFTDNSAMDIASMTDLANYKITYRDGGSTEVLPIIEVKAKATEYPGAYNPAKKGVTLITESQDIKKSYTIEISNVADEYGNAMKATKKFIFQGRDVDTNPPYVTKVEYVNTNTVKVTFDNTVNKATAQDVANYQINNDIGSPIAAKLGDDNKTVTLTTQTLSANKSYTITITNVEDKFGNAIGSIKVGFVATATSLDTTAPTLDYVYAANNKEVHLNFDEAIATKADQIKVGDLTFVFSGFINDKTTVVYKATGTDKLTLKEYSLDYVAGQGTFADKAGNTVKVADLKETSFYGSNADNEAPEVVYVEQLNSRKIRVIFSEPVDLDGKLTISGYAGLEVEPTEDTADTHVTEWDVDLKGALPKAGNKITLKFGTIDLAGVAAKDEVFEVQFDDTVAPAIVGVTAVNNGRVEVEYDEDLASGGTYFIYTYNEKGEKVGKNYTGTVPSSAMNKVRISITTTASEIYYLEVKAGARDLANNREILEDMTWDFPGSSIVGTSQYITGVAIINANTVNVSSNAAIPSGTGNVVVYEVYDGGKLAIGNANSDGTKTTISVVTDVPLLEGKTYEVEIGTMTYTFKGITPDLDIALAHKSATDNTVELSFIGDTVDEYDYEIFDATLSSVEQGSTDKTNKAIAITADGEYYVVLSKNGVVLYSAKVELKPAQ